MSKFRLLIAGDFGGRNKPGKPVPIDPGNFDEVLARTHVEVRVGEGDDMLLRFADLDDFHPDRLLENVPLLRKIRAAAAEAAKPQPAAPPRPATGSLLDDIADATPDPVITGDLFDQAIHAIATRHSVPKPSPDRQAIAAEIDAALVEALRAVLHHPNIQTVEAAWRSVFFLLQRVEVDETLDVAILDATEEQLAGIDLSASGPWSLVAGLYTFEPEDGPTLARIAQATRAAGAPFVAHGTPSRELRRSSNAEWIGLVSHRFLLRLPYGRKSLRVESLDFEEMPRFDHESLLWGNPSIAVACLLASSFQRSGWDMRPGDINRLTGIPVHVIDEEAVPQAEQWMTDREAERLIDLGVMPLASIKHSDAIQLVSFRSTSDPARLLAGPWTADR